MKLLFLLPLLSLITGGSSILQPGPQIDVERDTVYAGERIAIHGAGFGSFSVLQVHWDINLNRIVDGGDELLTQCLPDPSNDGRILARSCKLPSAAFPEGEVRLIASTGTGPNIRMATQTFYFVAQPLAIATPFDPSSLEDTGDYIRLGESYRDHGMMREALLAFDQALQLDVLNAQAYLSISSVYLRLGQSDLAIQYLDHAIQLAPLNADAYFLRGLAHRNLGNLERAIRDFDRAIQLAPEYADVYLQRGTVNSWLGNHEQALLDLGESLRLMPENAEGYLLRGLAYRNLGRLDLAIKEFTLAIKFNPELAEAYCHRGNGYKDLDQPRKAIQDYTMAVEISDDLREKQSDLAKLLLDPYPAWQTGGFMPFKLARCRP